MSKILIQTGFGYYKDQQDHIVSKAELPAGTHDLIDGLIYVEVDNQAELDTIEVYQDPVDLQIAQQEQKIRDKSRALAIAELIKDGNWP